jgi:hypothetical protein
MVAKAMKTHKKIILMTRKKSIIRIDDGFMGKTHEQGVGLCNEQGSHSHGIF